MDYPREPDDTTEQPAPGDAESRSLAPQPVGEPPARVVIVPWARPLSLPGFAPLGADGLPHEPGVAHAGVDVLQHQSGFPPSAASFEIQPRPDGAFAGGSAWPIEAPVPWTASPADDHDPMLLKRTGRWAALADAGILVAAALMMEIALWIGMAVLDGAPLDADGELDMAALKPWLLPMLTVRAGLLTLLILLLCRVRGQRVAAVGMTVRRLALNGLLGIGVCGVVYGFLLAFVVIVMLCVPELQEQMEANQGKLHDMLPDLSLAGFLWLAILVGFYEELVFRGFLMPRLRRCFGSWIPAVLVSTAVFTALHAFEQVAVALPVIAMLSLAFSLVTIWRRSIVPAIVAHALFDFSQFAMLYMAMQSGAAS